MTPRTPFGAVATTPFLHVTGADPWVALFVSWVAYARAMAAYFEALAALRGDTFAAPSATEMLAVARLGAACGAEPWPGAVPTRAIGGDGVWLVRLWP
jgi:hypothetical protein